MAARYRSRSLMTVHDASLHEVGKRFEPRAILEAYDGHRRGRNVGVRDDRKIVTRGVVGGIVERRAVSGLAEALQREGKSAGAGF